MLAWQPLAMKKDRGHTAAGDGDGRKRGAVAVAGLGGREALCVRSRRRISTKMCKEGLT